MLFDLDLHFVEPTKDGLMDYLIFLKDFRLLSKPVKSQIALNLKCSSIEYANGLVNPVIPLNNLVALSAFKPILSANFLALNPL